MLAIYNFLKLDGNYRNIKIFLYKKKIRILVICSFLKPGDCHNMRKLYITKRILDVLVNLKKNNKNNVFVVMINKIK